MAQRRTLPIDNDLPLLRPCNLSRWNRIFDMQDNSKARDGFGLTGLYTDETLNTHRAKFDVDKHRIPDRAEIKQTFDVDSAIALLPPGKLPINPNTRLEFYPLPDQDKVLRRSLHVPPVKVLGDREEYESVHLHHIPNTRFGEIRGGNTIIRIFLPALRSTSSASQPHTSVDPEHLKLLYDRALRPAAQETIPEDNIRSLPATYKSEDFRASKGRGSQRQQTGRTIPGQYVEAWVEAINVRVNNDPLLKFARGFFMVVEIRGIKERTRHNVLEAEEEEETPWSQRPRVQALDKALEDWVITEQDMDFWNVDIGTNISVTIPAEGGQSLFARTDKHAEIIKHFTEKTIDRSNSYVRSRSGLGCYSRDEIAHLGSVGGFRLDLSREGQLAVTLYLQLYSSEKSVTYHLGVPCNAKRTSPTQVIGNWLHVSRHYYEALGDTFGDHSDSHNAAVRIESRVPLKHAVAVHGRLSEDDIRNWMIVIPSSAYWGFKFRRAQSIHSILMQIMDNRMDVDMKNLPAVASLIVLLVWMTNALVNRPDDGGKWDKVHNAGCVHSLIDGELVANRPLIMYNIHSLKYTSKGIPRLSGQRLIPEDVLLYVVDPTRENKLSLLQLCDLINETDRPRRAASNNRNAITWGAGDEVELPSTAAPPRSTKQRMVLTCAEGPAPNHFPNLPPLPPRHDDPDSAREGSEDDERPRHTLQEQLSRIIHNYPVQVFGKVPNCQGLKRSWCTLELPVQSDIFEDADTVADMFLSIYSLGKDSSWWEKTVNGWFPTKAELKDRPNLQGLDKMGVLQELKTIFKQHDEKWNTIIVEKLRKHANEKWRWMPALVGGHLWRTVKTPPACARQIGEIAGGPCIVFNPQFPLPHFAR
ncbi:hypothetical protein FRC11_006612 [Ceratobasidium sp. 423]|nr:hypothetical protein FRC11_006612 [Ceratobasidium sp. 423]